MQVEGEQVSDLIIEGDATYNAENGFLTFNSNGTVKVHYTVTNAFGTRKVTFGEKTEKKPRPAGAVRPLRVWVKQHFMYKRCKHEKTA